MKRYSILILLLVAFNGIAQEKNNNIQSQLDKIVEDKMVMGVAAAYAVDGEIIEQATAGYTDKDTGKLLDSNTKMRMGSIAKTMTALAVMQLVEREKIDLDAPIQTYLPDYPKHKKTQITIRHLLSHTSGISGYKDGRESNTTTEYPTLYDALSLFKDRDLLFEPGTQYSYTTYGYTVLGAILEKVTEQTFEAYMHQNIFVKAGMTHTGVEKFGEVLENESKLYTRNNGKGKAKPAKENNLSNRIPAGGFYTTIGDMLKFGDAVINHTLVKKETLKEMRQHHSLEKENNAYGFGWFLYNPKPYEGAIIGHSGAQTGCTSFLFIVPEKKAVSIILSNTSRAQSSVNPIANDLLRLSLSKTTINE
ncbi:beta-lactamase family protein [Maribacter algarum]|uniref:Beta-lactamase family protein n=1 Tax=Maribacter algarum (ex Zhang et al. 2020) TaxID=2578118 RepID=A0A5S3PPX7_9FLAO|nr:serine hydrolase domain-containing protein [Maribacter algarum]TMM56797.1 beta-lactamase family protein [Maribacter algarum]